MNFSSLRIFYHDTSLGILPAACGFVLGLLFGNFETGWNLGIFISCGVVFTGLGIFLCATLGLPKWVKKYLLAPPSKS